MSQLITEMHVYVSRQQTAEHVARTRSRDRRSGFVRTTRTALRPSRRAHPLAN